MGRQACWDDYPRLYDDLVRFNKGPKKRWLLRHPRVHLHFTPTSASWLNRVACWFAILTARQLKRGRFHSTQALEAAIRAYIAQNNIDSKPFV